MRRLVSFAALIGVAGLPVRQGVGQVLAIEMPSRASERPNSGAAPSETDWSRVVALRSGLKVVVTAEGTGALVRRIVIADDASIVVLNDGVNTVPPEVLRLCEDLATNQPKALAATLSGGNVEKSDLSLGPSGVVIGGRRVADLGDILTRLDRKAVIEIVADSETDPAKKRKGMAFIVAGFASMAVGAAFKNPEAGPGVGWFIGVPLVVVGIVVRHESGPRGLIYRRPEHAFLGP